MARLGKSTGKKLAGEKVINVKIIAQNVRFYGLRWWVENNIFLNIGILGVEFFTFF